MPFLDRGKPRSLMVEVMDWMLAPLAIVWPAAIAASYAIGISIAEVPFDRELRARVRSIVDEIEQLPKATSGASLRSVDRVRFDPIDTMSAQVRGLSGEVLFGDGQLPAAKAADCSDGEVRFRTADLEGGESRIACALARLGDRRYAAVQVAEPVSKRQAHAKQVALTVVGVVMVLVPLTMALVIFGIVRGLAPVRRLRESIEKREPSDLSPIPSGVAPEELAPLVETLNGQLERVRNHLAAQRRFVADASHQLRTPLAALKTQTQVARGAQTLEEAEERLDRIGESADHLGRLATQLLALARADDAREGAWKDIELNAAARTACHVLADAAIAKGIRLGLDAPEGELHVNGDKDLVHELLVNLIDNAIRYTPSGGEVTVSSSDEVAPTLEVADSGPGIPEAERELVFERFYRVLGTGVSGSGLGLAIVKSIADRHGARVEILAGDEGGARVRVRFPPRGGPTGPAGGLPS